MRREVSLEEISDGRLYELNDMVKADCGGCEGCSQCCRGMGSSIILDPYDVYRLTTGIGKSMQELLATSVELNVVDGVILPNLKAPIVTMLIISGVGVYNDFYNPFLYMPSRDLKVISTALFAFKGPYGTNWPVILAGVMIVILPILLLFLFLQKYIYNGVAGSVK